MVLVLVLVSAGFVFGSVVGRWWAVLAAVAVGVWIALSTEIEAVPGWYLGLVYSGLSAVGISVGVLLRRRLVSRF
jgi:hypothetical protein